jgi:DNA-binding NarL/FixJ family response regulator
MRLLDPYWLRPPQTTRRPLSRREEDVVTLLARGDKTRIIAAQLGIDVKTVWTHYTHVRQKWQLPDLAALRAEAVKYVSGHLVAC